MIDTHAHLDSREYDADREECIKRALDAGVSRIINIATDFGSCKRVTALADKYDSLFAVVGVHPHDAATWEGRESAKRLKEFAAHPKVVAIGEIGLDYYRNLSPREDQRQAFIDQIEVAQELNLPIVIHNRDAFDEIFTIVQQTGAHIAGGVFHCFSGTVEQAKECVTAGFHISVNGIITYKNANMADVGRQITLDRILIETDCPYLTPHPNRGKRNEPAFIPLIAEKLAQLRGMIVESISNATDENARRVFGTRV